MITWTRSHSDGSLEIDPATGEATAIPDGEPTACTTCRKRTAHVGTLCAVCASKEK